MLLFFLQIGCSTLPNHGLMVNLMHISKASRLARLSLHAAMLPCKCVSRHCACNGAAYQNAIREQKLAAEISAAKRERDFYMGQVDKAKGIEAMKERKRKVCNNLSLVSRMLLP